MKTIGLIGGTTWASTLDYYRYFNQMVQERMGGNHSAKCIIYSINFQDLKNLAIKNDWDGITQMLIDMGNTLKRSGADCLLLGANTLHKVADKVRDAVDLPLIHVANATAEVINNSGLNKVGLLGTQVTMEEPFYKEILKDHHIDSITPAQPSREFIQNSIFNELGKGLILGDTKNEYLDIIKLLINEGSEGIILGCTEIPMIIKQQDVSVPVFDTTIIHAKAAVDFILK
ncbi:aspartate/glutamate racemase family protein [Bacteroidota bacterium]